MREWMDVSDLEWRLGHLLYVVLMCVSGASHSVHLYRGCRPPLPKANVLLMKRGLFLMLIPWTSRPRKNVPLTKSFKKRNLIPL